MTKTLSNAGAQTEATKDIGETYLERIEAHQGWVQHLAGRAIRIGDRVQVKNTALFDGRVGTIIPTSGHRDDPWDRYVSLEPDGIYGGQRIGVMLDQVERIHVPCSKHSYECLGYRRHKHRPRIKFRCKVCGDVIEIAQQTVRALVRGEAKRLRSSRIHRKWSARQASFR